ncbi:MAG: DsrE family protein [Burkholderiaceae bacterium]|nr:DsrE family protein [Burkholderiaceae bacterium]
MSMTYTAATRRRALVALLLVPITAAARTTAPWGGARELERSYLPSKAVYDVDTGEAAAFERVLDRVSYLNKVYEANPFESSIVIVVHGEAIELFGIRGFDRHRRLMERAHSLTQSGPIEFRICRADAAMRGYRPADLHGFARMVPMADAEIVRLQNEGYAYLR